MLQDLRNALRVLVRDRLFTMAAVCTLALCIGANSALFGIVHSVLIRPLPFAEPDRIVTIFNSYPGAGVARAGNAAPDYMDRREQVPALASVALTQEPSVTIGDTGDTERVTALRVTPSFFDVLGVRAVRGRTFEEAEGEAGGANVVILGHGLWQERFAGADDVVGSTMRINGNPYEIVGVLPRNFMFGGTEARLIVPLRVTPEMTGVNSRHANNFGMIGRLAPGASIEQAREQILEVNRRNEEQFPQFAPLLAQTGFTTRIEGLRDDLLSDVRGTLVLLQIGVLVVLLIGCVNIANLLLVRATSRSREWATRAALGAQWTRLARQLMTESIVLAIVGGALGLLVGYGMMQLFATYAAEHLPRGGEVAMNPTVVLATLALALLAGLVFGALPIARLRRPDLNSVFREDGRSATASRAALGVRGALVVAQVALAFALLSGAGLTLASFMNATSVDPGFRAGGVLTASVALPAIRYPDADAGRLFYESLVERVEGIGGVQAVGLTNVLPFSESQSASVVTAEHRRPQPGEPPVVPTIASATPGYFEAMGIDLVRGRMIQRSDDENGMPVVVIDEMLAQRLWPGEDALDKRVFQGAYDVGMPEEAMVMRTVVGIVRTIRTRGLVGEEPAGQMYLPYRQAPSNVVYLAVRTSGEPIGMVPAVRGALNELDADIPLFSVRTLEQRVAASLANERARTTLLIGFASIALLLAAVGLYGVLAYTVAQRSTEIGIRMALGSTTHSVFGLVLRQGLVLVAIGLAIGSAVSAAGTRLLSGMLHDVSTLDPAVHAAVLLVLAAVATLACLLPAWRAARVDPAIALKR